MASIKIPEAAITSMDACGFKEVVGYRNSRVFELSDLKNGELFQFFSPHILSFEDGKALGGVLGSMITPDARQLTLGKKIDEAYAITCYSANFSSLRMPPILGQNSDVDQTWCEQIASILRCFPTSFEELSNILKNDVDICGVPPSNMNVF